MISGTRYRLDLQIAEQRRLSREISRAQSDITTQTRVQTPSDDPAAAARIAQIDRNQANETVWAANTTAALALSDRVDSSLETIADRVDRAKTLLLSANNGTMSAADRQTVATELRGLADDIAAMAGETDARGAALYATGAGLAYPVGPGVTVTASASRTGVFDDIATAGGPKALTAILTDAADALLLADGDERDVAATASLAEIDVAAGSLSDARADQGVRAARLTSVRDRFAETKLVAQEERSALADTDIDETVIRLQAKLTALQAAQALFARTTQKGLFDYI